MGTNQIADETWEQTTWEGNRRAQLRHALSLTLRERLQAVEDMAGVTQRFREMRARNSIQNEKEPVESPFSLQEKGG